MTGADFITELFLGVLLDVVNDVVDCLDLLNSLIGDREVILVLDSLDKVYDIERICAEILLDVSLGCNSVLFNAELFYDELLDLVKYPIFSSISFYCGVSYSRRRKEKSVTL